MSEGVILIIDDELVGVCFYSEENLVDDVAIEWTAGLGWFACNVFSDD